MFIRVSTICFSILFAFLFATATFGQIDASTPNGKSAEQKEDLPKNIKETLAKQRIERDKKDFAELLDRCQEAIKLSDELEKSFITSNRISNDDMKKLARLEKLVKKIRSELGGEDDSEQSNNDSVSNPENPTTVISALKTLQSKTSQLFDEIKKSTRYSVSVIAIQTANVLLKLVKFIRFGN